MTRREFVKVGAMAGAGSSRERLKIPLVHVVDRHVAWKPGQIRRFTNQIWPEAVRDFDRCGIHFATREVSGEVLRYPTGRPLFKGLQPDAINMVITGFLPLSWDSGRAVSGAAARYEGFEICLIALDQAHPHQVPFLSVNTCVHELLHTLLADTAAARPAGWRGSLRESRIDWLATRLWLFGEGREIYDAALALRKPGQSRV
jgi:hypothetical protein